jgi:hypothetical protein
MDTSKEPLKALEIDVSFSCDERLSMARSGIMPSRRDVRGVCCDILHRANPESRRL